ncbi:hypothetical protein [Pseudomonas sp. PNPG3]|uniref:hypothetical protein n=1 Tax=Pseudomonas sp. PNPG3 TaxID=2919497 RepID=UPI001FFD12F0|nr:hypothetical protein [Pseudomonas sp. PNPG3]MCK2122143.1 hypothetical protein [Pseudomonas sp. PNPG3]
MYSISLFVTALCMVFVYRAQRSDLVIARAGLNRENPEVWRQPVMRFAARVRLLAGLTVMVLVVLASYRLPIEIGQMITSAQNRQFELQEQRLVNRLAAEKRHTAEMIETFGGRDGFLSYLSSHSERQFIQK